MAPARPDGRSGDGAGAAGLAGPRRRAVPLRHRAGLCGPSRPRVRLPASRADGGRGRHDLRCRAEPARPPYLRRLRARPADPPQQRRLPALRRLLPRRLVGGQRDRQGVRRHHRGATGRVQLWQGPRHRARLALPALLPGRQRVARQSGAPDRQHPHLPGPRRVVRHDRGCPHALDPRRARAGRCRGHAPRGGGSLEDVSRSLPPRSRVLGAHQPLRGALGQGPRRRRGRPRPGRRAAAATECDDARQPAARLRRAAAHQALGRQHGAPGQLGEQLEPAARRVRQRDRCPLATAARWQHAHRLPASARCLRRRRRSALRCRPHAVLIGRRRRPLAGVRVQPRQSGARAAPAHPRAGCRQLRRLLPSERRHHLHIDGALRRRSVRDRLGACIEPVPLPPADGSDPPARVRAGPRMVPHSHAERARHVPALGVHRHPALRLADPVPHEPGWHGADGVLRQQLLLAELDVLCATHSRQRDQVRHRRRRAPRQPAHGRAGALRRQQGQDRGRGRHPAHPRVGQAGRSDPPRRPDSGQLAQVPPPLPAQREVLPGLVQADTGIELGHLPGRCVRQPDAHQGGTRLRPARAHPAAAYHSPAGAGRPSRHEAQGRARLPDRRLRRPRPQRRSARRRQEAPPADLPLRLPQHGRPGEQGGHRRAVGCEAHHGHGAG